MIDSIEVDSVIAGILESPSESKSIELKPSIPWRDINTQEDLQCIVKSILGMSNIKDGGKIILGLPQQKDKTFKTDGMTAGHLQTYNQDRIYDIVQNYGNPRPIFEVKNVEYKGKFFIVFLVQEFLYSPVICTRSGKNNAAEPLSKGAVYTRTHKPETKRIESETEMREILNLALDKELELLTPRVRRYFGIQKTTPVSSPNLDDKQKFQEELKDIK